MRLIFLLVAASFLSGCTAMPGLPNMSEFKHASIKAVKDPNVWLPLIGAGLVVASDADNSIAKSQGEGGQGHLFGDPQGTSSDLYDLASLAFIVSEIAAPRESFSSSARRATADVGTVVFSMGLAEGLKQVTHRKRPDKDNYQSFTSGHATYLGTTTAIARRNLRKTDMPQWLRTPLNLGLYGTAIAGSWARVEAGKHHPSDVLVGYALGSFVAKVVEYAFLTDDDGIFISLAPMDNGGILTVTIPLGGD